MTNFLSPERKHQLSWFCWSSSWYSRSWCWELSAERPVCCWYTGPSESRRHSHNLSDRIPVPVGRLWEPGERTRLDVSFWFSTDLHSSHHSASHNLSEVVPLCQNVPSRWCDTSHVIRDEPKWLAYCIFTTPFSLLSFFLLFGFFWIYLNIWKW